MTTLVLRQRWLVYLIRALLIVPIVALICVHMGFWQIRNAAANIVAVLEQWGEGLKKVWPEHD